MSKITNDDLTWSGAGCFINSGRQRVNDDKGKEHCLHEKTCEQQCFTTLEVAVDWHEIMVLQCIMQPSIVRDSRQLDPQHSMTDIPPPQSAAPGLHPVSAESSSFLACSKVDLL